MRRVPPPSAFAPLGGPADASSPLEEDSTTLIPAPTEEHEFGGGSGPTTENGTKVRTNSQAMETEVDYEMPVGRFLLPPSPHESTHPMMTPPPTTTSTSSNSWGGFCCFLLKFHHSRSLASAPTTPWYATWGIPLLILSCHGLFYHGQTADMWRLHSEAQVDCWYNATSYEAKGVYTLMGLNSYDIPVQLNQSSTVQTFTYYTAIQELWDAAGMDSVGLWLPRVAAVLLILFSGVWPHLKLVLLNLWWLLRPNSPRLFWWLATLGKWSLSDVLVVCVMLGVLHMDWNVQPDVVLHGVIDQSPTIMKVVSGIYTSSQICTKLLERECTEAASTTPSILELDLKCTACLKFVDSSFDHPSFFQSRLKGVADGISTSGGGLMTLRVQGLTGIYSFCAAVVLSIALSCLVDIYSIRGCKNDANNNSHNNTSTFAPAEAFSALPPRSRTSSAASAQQPRSRTTSATFHEQPYMLLQDVDGTDTAATTTVTHELELREESSELELGDAQHAPPNGHHHHNRDRSMSLSSSSSSATSDHRTTDRSSLSAQSRHFSCYPLWQPCAMLLAAITCAIVWNTIPADSLLSRRVAGVGPHWLHQVTGVEWDTTYSLKSLAEAVGEAGSMDLLLQATFAWFCLVGPALRAALCVICLCTFPSCRSNPWLLTTIEFLGAFCAVDVLAIAAFLVHLLIPSTTATIINLPLCSQIADAQNNNNNNDDSNNNSTSTSTCFQVFLDPEESFQWLINGTILLLVVAQLPQWLLRSKLRQEQQLRRQQRRQHR